MIFYFSATGNTKYVAERLAREFSCDAVSIEDCIEDQRFEFTADVKEKVVFVSPTYFWALPPIVDEFISKVVVRNASESYFVATYGKVTGCIGNDAKRKLHRRGLPAVSLNAVQMPDNWTPKFDVSDEDKIAATLKAAETDIRLAIEAIWAHRNGDFMAYKQPGLSLPIAQASYKSARKTSRFTVDDTCISCGRCAQSCPTHAIELHEGRPVWVKDTCMACLRCLHRCPKFAIQRGEKTRKHGQYVNPYVEL